MEPSDRSQKARGQKRPVDKSAWIKRGLGKQIANIDSSTLAPCSSTISSDSAFEQVCSYNWAKTTGLSIYVPGAPPKWTAPAIPVTVPQDSGVYFIDLNASKMPSCPFTPLFASLRATNPAFSFAGVDVLTNRNSLRKLLDFAGGRASQSFRIDASLVRDTLVLFRHERVVREVLPGKGAQRQQASYGHNFEATFTTAEPGLEASFSHHRTIAYNLGALKCVVQFEVDAWYKEEAQRPGEGSSSGMPPAAESAKEQQATDPDLNSVNQALAGLSLKAPDTSCGSSYSAPPGTDSSSRQQQVHHQPKTGRRGAGNLSILQGGGGFQPSRQQLAKIKVRSRKPFQVSKAIPQMWFGRTPYLISGVHEEGVFSELMVEKVGERFASWEDRNQEVLGKLVAVIARVKEILMMKRQEMVKLDNGEKNDADMAWAITCNHKVRPARLMVHEIGKDAKRAAVPHEYVMAFWPEI